MEMEQMNINPENNPTATSVANTTLYDVSHESSSQTAQKKLKENFEFL